MTLQPLARRFLLSGALLLALAVLIGAFGAHGLKALVTADKLATFETGVRYHFYHAFGILFLGLLQQQLPSFRPSLPYLGFLAGILLFSGNCYLYVVTGIRAFALVVPVGGVLFVASWVGLVVMLLKLR